MPVPTYLKTKEKFARIIYVEIPPMSPTDGLPISLDQVRGDRSIVIP